MSNTSPVLVTGGTGTLGRLVVPRLQAAGRDVRVLSRHDHDNTEGVEHVQVDLREGRGIDSAVAGVETVLHLAGGAKGDDEATRHLVEAASRADVQHIVYISVIGADSIPLGYFRQKAESEQILADSGIPWTILRAAQFHDFVLTAAKAMAKLPIVPVPSAIRWQPVAADEVAARLVELTLGDPAGRVHDLAGPTVYPMAELVRSYLAATGRRRPIMPVRLPGKVGRAYRAGENLSLGAEQGKRTWQDFLAERVEGRVVAPRP